MFVTEKDISEILSDIYMADCQSVEFQNLGNFAQLTVDLLDIDPQFTSLVKIHAEIENLLNARLTDVITQILTESQISETPHGIFDGIHQDDGDGLVTAAAS